MKEKFADWIKRCYKDIIALGVITVMTTLLLMYFYGVQHMDFSIPFGYDGTDTMSSLVTAKMVSETGWNLGTDRLAAPYTYDNSSDIIAGMHNADVLTMKFFVTIFGSDEIAKAVNLTFITAFYFIAWIAYFVLRKMRLKEWVAAGGALTYAFLPFIFFRNIEHLVLSCYYFVPLLVLLCMWIYEDERFLRLDKGFFKYKRNIAAILFCLCIASSGIAYWQFFGCFFLCATALINVVKTKEFRYIRQSLLCVAGIVFFMILGCMPELIGLLGGSGTGTPGRLRSMPDAEYYCLKIIQMIMPVRGHGIPYLQSRIDEYNTTAPLVTENASAYLGIMGVIGLIALLLILFKKKSDSDSAGYKRLCALSELNLCGILFGTLGGFGTCFFVFVSQTIRGYNRISVYIAFFCIAAVCIMVNEISARMAGKGRRTVLAAGFSLFVLLGIWEQNPRIPIPYGENYDKWNNDKAFVAQIEASSETGTMIYQLPYIQYPEGGVLNDMADSELFVGYIHSDSLKWSFGIVKETEENAWNMAVAALPAGPQVEELRSKGFGGIYINRKGYKDGEWQLLEQNLSAYLDQEPLVSENGTLSYFSLR